MEDIFESLKTFVMTDEDLSRHEVILQDNDIPWNKGLTGYTTQPCSEETKRKISESRKGQPSKLKGIPLSEELKQKISIAKKGCKCHWKGKTGEGTAMYGKTHSEETKRKQSESAKGIQKTWLKGKPRSDETKRKIAEAQARRHAIRKALNNGESKLSNT